MNPGGYPVPDAKCAGCACPGYGTYPTARGLHSIWSDKLKPEWGVGKLRRVLLCFDCHQTSKR